MRLETQAWVGLLHEGRICDDFVLGERTDEGDGDYGMKVGTGWSLLHGGDW